MVMVMVMEDCLSILLYLTLLPWDPWGKGRGGGKKVSDGVVYEYFSFFFFCFRLNLLLERYEMRFIDSRLSLVCFHCFYPTERERYYLLYWA